MVMVPKALPEISVRVPPDDPNPTKNRENPDTLVMQVDAQGGLRLNEKPVSAEELERRLSDALADRDRRAVFLDCDPEAGFGEAVAALDIAKRAGADVLGVIKARNEPIPERLPPR